MSMASVTLDALMRAEANGDAETVEAFLAAVLSGRANSEEHQLEAFRLFRNAGRDADLIKIVSMNPRILEFSGTLKWAVLAAAGSGWPELAEQLNLFTVALKDPDRFFPEIGSPLMRCAHQLIKRGQISDPLRQFVVESLNRTRLTSESVMEPIVLATYALLKSSADTLSATTALAESHGIERPEWVSATLARQNSARVPDTLARMAGSTRAEFFPESQVLCIAGSGGFRESLTAMDEAAAHEAGMVLPELSLDRVLAGFRQAYEIALGFSDAVLEPYRKALDAAKTAFTRPMLVISTGRAGTQSLNTLLLESESFAPFHFYNFHQEPGDLNRLFYRMLMGDLTKETLRPHLERLVHDRMIEMA